MPIILHLLAEIPVEKPVKIFVSGGLLLNEVLFRCGEGRIRSFSPGREYGMRNYATLAE